MRRERQTTAHTACHYHLRQADAPAASGMTHNAALAKVVKVARDSRIRSGAVTDPADASTKETRRGMKHEGIIADAAEPLPQNG